MVKIALDVMGGDNAPTEIINGAISAVKKFNVSIILVGQEKTIKSQLKIPHPSLSIVNANDVIDMNDSPLQAYKKKKNSSIHIGLQLVKEGKADGFVSAGNTGVLMSCSLFILGRIPGIDRPALATLLPTKKGHAFMLDMGSNVDSKPIHLEQYAMMGHHYSKQVLHIASPKIGLLNIGEEDEKGNQLTQHVFEALSNSNYNFIGNIEGKDILFHKADVIVCDGFVGNTLLKFGEGCVEFILTEIRKGILSSFKNKIGGMLLKPVFKQLKKKIDYEEYGGAPLLGINGISIVAHGKSKEKAIVSAIRTAKESIETNIVEKISMTLN